MSQRTFAKQVGVELTPSNYTPGSSPGVEGQLEGIDTALGSGDKAIAYDTTSQAIAVVNTWQDLTFDTNVDIVGWAHTPGSALFTAPSPAGLFMAICQIHMEQTGGGTNPFALRFLFNGVEVAGSFRSHQIPTNSVTWNLSQAWPFTSVASQDFKVQISGSNTNMRTRLGGVPAAPTTNVSATLSIRRF